MTTHHAVWRKCSQLRGFIAAAGLRYGTARMKFAALWPVQHAWNFALDGQIGAALAGVGLGL